MTDTAQRLKSYPPVYPNGWYHLANCDEVGKGEVMQVEGVGRKFAVWRSSKGEVNENTKIYDSVDSIYF